MNRGACCRLPVFAVLSVLAMLRAPPGHRALASTTTYTITDLGSLTPNGFSTAFAISNSGYITGLAGRHAVYWQGTSIMDLGAPPANSGQEALGVNNRGEIVGDTFYFASQTSLPFWTTGGALQSLPTLGFADARAASVNDRGEIAGTAGLNVQDPSDNLGQPYRQRAVVWNHGAITDLGTLGGPSSIADTSSVLNNRGDVVGTADYDTRVNPELGGYDFHAALWQGTAGPHPTVQDLGALSQQQDFSISDAQGINDADQVVGWSLTDVPDLCFGGVEQWGFLWDRGRMHGLPPLAGDCDAVTLALNDRGQAVGYSAGLSVGGGFVERAVLWTNGQAVDLNTLIPASSGWSLTFASAINDAGEIVGFGHNAQGVGRAFLLHPRPGA